MWKRFMSAFLAVCLVLTLMPMTMASDEEPTFNFTIEQGEKYGTATIGTQVINGDEITVPLTDLSINRSTNANNNPGYFIGIHTDIDYNTAPTHVVDSKGTTIALDADTYSINFWPVVKVTEAKAGGSKTVTYHLLWKEGEETLKDVTINFVLDLSNIKLFDGDEQVYPEIPETYTVTYAANGGTGTMKADTAIEGEKFTLPENGFTAPKDKKFAGWMVEGELKQPKDQIDVAKDITVTASWANLEVYTATFHANNGTDAKIEVKVTEGNLLVFPSAKGFSAPAGKVFVRWRLGDNGYDVGDKLAITGDVDVYAHWKTPDPKSFKITFDTNGGYFMNSKWLPVIDTEADGTLPYLPLDPVHKLDLVFAGWYTKPVGGEKITTKTVFTKDTTVYAQWALPDMNLVVLRETENGKVASSHISAKKGDIVKIVVKPDAGYQIDSVLVVGHNGRDIKLTADKKNAGVYTFKMPGSMVVVNATFKKIPVVEEETKPSVPGNIKLPFMDVTAQDWFYDAVKYVYANDLMSGTALINFGPSVTTTRGMIVTILWRLEGEPKAGAADFSDVAKDAYYAKAVAWAAEKGIVSGLGDGKFGPDQKITREQLAVMLYNYAQYKEYNTNNYSRLSQIFDDAGKISGYAVNAMSWANAEGLITGVTGTTLDPKGYATRAQVASILMRFCENVID